MVDSQIPLPLGISERFTFANFVAVHNEHILRSLKTYIRDGKSGFLYLWGKAGTGKTHLLHASCNESAQLKRNPIYLPLTQYLDLEPEIFSSMENQDLVCIDDIHYVEGKEEWEKELFYLYNRLQELGGLLIVTSIFSPSGSTFDLADLKSRLSSGIIYHLVDLDDEQKLIVVKEKAKQRGVELSNDVLEYLGKRVTRDLNNLLSWLDRLDEASLSAKRKITVPLLRELLKS
jgi:DnaA family protein